MIVRADTLKPGDRFRHGEHTVEVVGLGTNMPDRFGHDLMRLWCRIVEGPNRIGDEGDMPFGRDGVVVVVA